VGVASGGEDIGCEACVVSHLRPTDFSAILASRSGAPVASDAGGPRWQSRRRAPSSPCAGPRLLGGKLPDADGSGVCESSVTDSCGSEAGTAPVRQRLDGQERSRAEDGATARTKQAHSWGGKRGREGAREAWTWLARGWRVRLDGSRARARADRQRPEPFYWASRWPERGGDDGHGLRTSGTTRGRR